MARTNKNTNETGNGTDALGIKTNNYISKSQMKQVRNQVRQQNARASLNKTASGISYSAPTFYNPLYTDQSLMLPRDRKQINVWCRHYYQTEALVASCIDLYADLPITGWTIECSNPHVRKFMEDMCSRLKLREVLQGIALEFFMIGDVFIMNELDDSNKTWKRLVVLNPDQVEVRRNPLVDTPIIELIPDQNLKEIVFDKKPRELYNYFAQFLPEVITAVKSGQNIPLHPAHITHLRHKPTPYGVYGNPLLKRIFKTLMYKEMIRRAQFAIAERFVTPLKIFKLGTIDEPPTQQDIDEMQAQLDMVLNDPKMVLVTTPRLTADWQGIGGKTLQLNGEYDFTEKETLGGLGVARAFIDGGGTNFATASIGGNAFLQKLENFREMLKDFIEEKVFKPILELNGFFDTDPDTDEEFLIKVEFKWDSLKLQDEASIQQALLGLRQQNMVSAKTLLNAFHINPETEAVNIAEERDTIFDSMRIMSRQVAMNQETSLAIQLQYQQLLMKMQGDPNQGIVPQAPIGSMPQPQGQQGAVPPAGGNAAMANVPTPGQPGTLPRGLFTPVDSMAARPPQVNASKMELELMIKEAIARIDDAIKDEDSNDESEDS